MAKRIPRRFRDATLDSYRPKNKSQADALAAVQDWVHEALLGNGPMLALVGSQGTGKSHLLYATARGYARIVKRLREEQGEQARQLPRIEPWYRLADQLRYSDNRDSVRNAIYSSSVVMIDEVRPTASTAFDDTELAKLACHAYDQQLAVLITTNVNPLEKVMGPAAADRFSVAVVTGPSER